jgi:hypothetical protein
MLEVVSVFDLDRIDTNPWVTEATLVSLISR